MRPNHTDHAREVPLLLGNSNCLVEEIGVIFTEDTLEAASQMLRAIGSLASSCDDDGTSYGAFYPLLSTIAAAIDYEKENPRLSGSGAAKQGAAS